MEPADPRAHEGRSSLCSPRSSRGATPVLEINDERVFVTTVDWTVAPLSAITVSLHRPLMVTRTLETVGN